jgi:hypothetical protein
MTAAAPDALDSGFVHATAVVIGEAGVVIFGPPGSGKSSLALALIEGAGSGCFAGLVGDDRVRLTAHGARLLVEGHPRIRGQIERRGQGVLTRSVELIAVVRLVVELGAADAPAARLPDILPPFRQGEAEAPRLALSAAASATAQADIVRSTLRLAAEI